MISWSNDNILQVSAAVKKGGGVHAILALLQDVIAFQDKVGATIEAQDMAENKKKLEDFSTRIGEMYESLLEMAKGGVRSIRQNPEEGDMEEESMHGRSMRDEKPDFTLSDPNVIQELPR